MIVITADNIFRLQLFLWATVLGIELMRGSWTILPALFSCIVMIIIPVDYKTEELSTLKVLSIVAACFIIITRIIERTA